LEQPFRWRAGDSHTENSTLHEIPRHMQADGQPQAARRGIRGSEQDARFEDDRDRSNQSRMWTNEMNESE
jgi:hypothetical protein